MLKNMAEKFLSKNNFKSFTFIWFHHLIDQGFIMAEMDDKIHSIFT